MNDASFLTIRSAPEFLDAGPARNPSILEPILAPGTLAPIYGPPGAGKSFLALVLALAEDGARFELRVEKARHQASGALVPIEAQLCTGADGLAQWQWHRGESAALRRAAPLLQQGMRAEAVAKAIGVSPRTAYRLQRRARELG